MKSVNQNLMGKFCTILIFSAILTACGGSDSKKENDDTTPIQWKFSDIPITEGDSGTTAATFNIVLSASSTETITVNYATSNDTATEPADYQSKSGTLSFAPGETEKTVTVNVVGDTTPEPDEKFKLTLSDPDDPSNNAVAWATIVDDDTPTLQIGNISITEGDSGTTAAMFNITLSASSTDTVTVDYTTSNDTATEPDDYQSKNGTLSFAPGETEKTVTVNVVADTTLEPDEKFKLTLSNPGNADLNSNNAVGWATIVNDDDNVVTPPTLQVGDINITEGNSGTTAAIFNITLSASSTNTVTVNYTTSDITATAPDDYQSKSGILSFASGETSKTVAVNVVGDTVAELNETFRLTLSNPANASLLNAVGVATITNDDTDSTVLLSNPGPQSFDEEQDYTIDIIARPSARIFVSGMPPGMHWDEVTRRFDFRPDFIQGGKSWQVTMEAVDGTENDTQIFTIEINNTIQPPWPTFVSSEDLYRVTKLKMKQVTDDFLDSPGYKGREFTANLAIPTKASATNMLPVRIGLHGYGGSPGTVGREGYFGIAPHDANNTWWTGYNEWLPGGDRTSGSNPNYTQRRVMHLLSYLLEGCPGLPAGVGSCPGADPDQVLVSGQSMGGTGALFLAINYGRHFTEILPRIGGTTPHFLSPGHQAGLTSYWGSKELGLPGDDKGTNVWDLYDASRAALSNKDFRNLHFSTISGKNDPVISFDAMVRESPVTGISFLSALQQEGIGHLVAWDQRAHTGQDNPLSADWWKALALDATSFLRRNLAFPAFSNGSADDDAGKPDGAGGYTGTLRGAKNRYFRWDSANIIDTRSQLSIPVRVKINTTGTPPDSGYPPKGDDYFGQLPITTDVTIRRIQQFQTLPGEAINWSYNGESGTVSANDDGSVTVQNLEMTTSFTPLVFTRP